MRICGKPVAKAAAVKCKAAGALHKVKPPTHLLDVGEQVPQAAAGAAAAARPRQRRAALGLQKVFVTRKCL